MKQTVLLWSELLGIYVGVPALMYARVLPNWPIPFLLIAATRAFVVLRRDNSFDKRLLLRRTGIGAGFREFLLRDMVLLALLGAAVWIASPKLLFSMLKTRPLLWLLVMIFYPILSVYPQELMYRAYFFHRFKPFFGNGPGMIVASAVVFGFVHIIFGSWIPIALTVVGGVLFGATYRRSNSLLLACLEHAMFGDFIFTIGIGTYFYHLARH